MKNLDLFNYFIYRYHLATWRKSDIVFVHLRLFQLPLYQLRMATLYLKLKKRDVEITPWHAILMHFPVIPCKLHLTSFCSRHPAISSVLPKLWFHVRLRLLHLMWIHHTANCSLDKTGVFKLCSKIAFSCENKVLFLFKEFSFKRKRFCTHLKNCRYQENSRYPYAGISCLKGNLAVFSPATESPKFTSQLWFLLCAYEFWLFTWC